MGETVVITVPDSTESTTDNSDDVIADAIDEVEEQAIETIEEVEKAATNAIETVAMVAALTLDDIRTVVREEISVAMGAIMTPEEDSTEEVETVEPVIVETIEPETEPEPEPEPEPDEVPLTKRQKMHQRWYGS